MKILKFRYILVGVIVLVSLIQIIPSMAFFYHAVEDESNPKFGKLELTVEFDGKPSLNNPVYMTITNTGSASADYCVFTIVGENPNIATKFSKIVVDEELSSFSSRYSELNEYYLQGSGQKYILKTYGLKPGESDKILLDVSPERLDQVIERQLELGGDPVEILEKYEGDVIFDIYLYARSENGDEEILYDDTGALIKKVPNLTYFVDDDISLVYDVGDDISFFDIGWDDEFFDDDMNYVVFDDISYGF